MSRWKGLGLVFVFLIVHIVQAKTTSGQIIAWVEMITLEDLDGLERKEQQSMDRRLSGAMEALCTMTSQRNCSESETMCSY